MKKDKKSFELHFNIIFKKFNSPWDFAKQFCLAIKIFKTIKRNINHAFPSKKFGSLTFECIDFEKGSVKIKAKAKNNGNKGDKPKKIICLSLLSLTSISIGPNIHINFNNTSSDIKNVHKENENILNKYKADDFICIQFYLDDIHEMEELINSRM